MHVEIIDSMNALGRVRENWDRVYADDPEAQYFLSFTWIVNWFELGSRWLVLAAKADPESGDYVAFFPVRLSTVLGEDAHFRNFIRMGGSYYAVYTGFICEPQHALAAVSAFGQKLLTLNWAELHLDDVFASEPRMNALLECFDRPELISEKSERPRHVTEFGDEINHDVYIYVRLGADWEEFLDNRLGSKTRYNARKFLRQVDAGGDYRVTIADADTIDRDLETFLRLWADRWEAHNPRYANFIVPNTRHMIRRCFDDGAIFMPVLWQGDEIVGAHILLADRQKGRLIGFLGGRDRSVKRPPPGFVLHLIAIRWGIANGFSVYDLGTGDFSYKYKLGAEEHLIERRLVRTRTGRNLHGELDGRALPIAIREALRCFDARHYARAEQGCQKILAFDPNNAKAKEILDQTKRATASVSAMLAEAVKLHKGKHLAEAGRLYKEVLAHDAENFDARHLLGATLFESGNAKAAEAHFRRALQLRPTSAPAFNNLGGVLQALGRLPEALDSYEQALRVRPDYAQALNNRGNVLVRMGKLREAIDSFEKAIAIAPDFAKAIANRDNVRQLMKASQQAQ